MIKTLPFSSIGKMVYKMQPDLANSLMSILSQTKPDYYDLSLIKHFKKVFCQVRGINQIPDGSKTGTLYLRHVFLAAIIKLYNPELLTGIHSYKMKRKLRSEVAHHLNWNPVCVSQSVPLIITRLTVYEDFEQDVAEVYREFKNYIKGDIAN